VQRILQLQIAFGSCRLWLLLLLLIVVVDVATIVVGIANCFIIVTVAVVLSVHLI